MSGGRAADIRRRRAAIVVNESSTGLIRSNKATHFLLLVLACAATPAQLA